MEIKISKATAVKAVAFLYLKSVGLYTFIKQHHTLRI